ncbi:MAG: alginate lyase family protein [Verrucomicrobiota bacterium]
MMRIYRLFVMGDRQFNPCFFAALVFLGILAMPDLHAAETDWRDIKSVESVVNGRPERIEALFAALDLKREGLEAVRKAWERGDKVAACEALLAYYRTGNSGQWLRHDKRATGDEVSTEEGKREEEPKQAASEDLLVRANDILRDVFQAQGEGNKGVVPRKNDGHWEWTHTGPNRDRQYANSLNRHGHLKWLLRAYRATGERKYIERLDQDLRDWLTVANGDPAPKGFGRGILEASIRMPAWAGVFYALQDEDAFTPAARLLMLAAVPGHADYMRKTLKRNHNFATMQMNGLGTLGFAFPEFREAEAWRTFAMKTLAREIKGQVYPDGAQIELTFGYHMVALNRFFALMETAVAAGGTVDADYRENVERMYGYVADVLRPDGVGPLNGDSDTKDKSAALRTAAAAFDRPDWLYVASRGTEGQRPAGPPSRFLPWAGQLVSRSGWDANAHWSFFDIGPYGHGGHGHPDKLHLSVMAHGRHLLVDTGRFAYQGAIAQKFRGVYANHSRGHNVILIDGKSQGKDVAKLSRPLNEADAGITEETDWATGSIDTFDGLEGKAAHRRTVLYRRGRYWVVVDRIESDRPRAIRAQWHFHPSVAVRLEDRTAITTDPDAGNLRLLSSGNMDWKVRAVRGQEKPELLGWYSARYGEVDGTTVVTYEANIGKGATTFAWLIVPGKGEMAEASLDLVKIADGQAELKVSVGELPSRHEVVRIKQRKTESP